MNLQNALLLFAAGFLIAYLLRKLNSRNRK